MNRLTESITAVCSEQLLEEKWLIVPSLRVGYQWLDQVARHGQPVMNVHVKTLVSMALDLAAPVMAAGQLTLASSRAGMLLTDRIIREFSQDQLSYLGLAQPSVGLAETVLASINAIRLAGLSALLARPVGSACLRGHWPVWPANQASWVSQACKADGQAGMASEPFVPLARLACWPGSAGLWKQQ